jgi:ureidoglycolate dehydrogenase (NAD+)
MPLVTQADLTQFSFNLLLSGGLNAQEAQQTAEQLVWANLRGVESHGVMRLPRYLEMLETGVMKGNSIPQKIHAFGAMALYDYGKGAGAPAMLHASEKACELAENFGLGWCSARNISHAGAIGYFSGYIAKKGFIALVMTASKPLMSYFGARGEALSTNPLSIGVPQGKQPLILDMSTSHVALGKVLAAKEAGRPIPKGWGSDAEGRDTQDAAAVAALLPMSGAKGSGLSLMIEVLASVLAGNAVIAPVLLGKKKGGFNGIVLVINPKVFGEAVNFEAAIMELADSIHALDPAEGVERVFLPGERGYLVQRERESKGIPLSQATFDNLATLAQKQAVALTI